MMFFRLALVALLFSSFNANADDGNRQIELAAGGKFDELVRFIEKKSRNGALTLRDQHALCYAYSKTKHYTQLNSCLDRLTGLAKSSRDRSTRLFGLDDVTPTIALMRAEALIELGQYASASTHAKQALDWIEANDGEDELKLQSLSALSIASTLSGNRADGEKYARQLEGTGKASFFGSTASSTLRSLSLAKAHMALGQYQAVLAALESDATFRLNVVLDDLISGAALRGASNWLWVDLPRAFMINKALLETGHMKEARNGFDRLLETPQIRSNGEIFWMIAFERGRIAEQDNDVPLAMKFFREAIDGVELQRSSINTEANKIGFVGDKQAVYAHLIRLAVRTNQVNIAFDYMERSRARALVDMLSQRQDIAFKGLHAEQIRQAYSELSTTESSSRTQGDIVDMNSGHGLRNLVIKQRAALIKADPDFSSLVTVQSPSLEAMQSRLKKNEMVLEYYLSGDSLYVALIDHELKILSLDGSGLSDEIAILRKSIADKNQDAIPRLKALYQRLIKPVEALIGHKTLIIVPHGPLHYLPFAALHDGQSYLVRQHGIRYLPSASLLTLLSDAKPSLRQDKILVMGNPDLNNPQLDLPWAEQEAKRVAALFPESKLLLRRQASNFMFKKLAPQYPIIHIASHGQFLGDSPMNSRLLLSQEGNERGDLTLADLYGLSLDARLITLSACQTGIGKLTSGDDVIGLTRGFLYAGAKNILASLWEVDDQITAKLMDSFYRHFLAGSSSESALQQAQSEISQSEAHPMLWAAFFITGTGL